MKTIALTGIREMEIHETPMPEIERVDDVLLKVEMVGVCGSDIHFYADGKIGSQKIQYPYVVGHECVATVAALGSGVTKLKVGETIVVEPAVACNECDQCRAGRQNTCRNIKFLATMGQLAGCMSEYIIMPEENCLPTKGKLSFEQGALCEPLTIGIYAVRQSKVNSGSTIAILGSGPIGLSCLVGAKTEGVSSIFITEKIEERLAMAKQAGATRTFNPDSEDVVKHILEQAPEGVDVVYECAGKQETLDQAVDLLKPGGKLMLIGIPRTERVSFKIESLRTKEISVINVRRQNNCTRACMDLIAEKKADVDFMVTHHFGYEQSKEAFDLVDGYKDGVVKAMIDFSKPRI